MKRSGLPINLIFIPVESEGIAISLNGKEIEYQTIVACKKALDKFLVDHSKEDVEDYNLEIRQEIRLEKEAWINRDKTIIEKIDSPGWVYLYKQGEYYKIGKSKSEDCRIQKYVTENPHPIELVDKWFSDTYSEAEEHLHITFSNKQHNREWFVLSNSDIVKLKKEIQKYVKTKND